MSQDEQSESDYISSDEDTKKKKKMKKNMKKEKKKDKKPPTPKKVQTGDPRPEVIGPIKIPVIYKGSNTSAFKVQSRQ